MKRFIEGEDRGQSTLFPERLEDWIGEDNPVRVIDVFVDELDLGEAKLSLDAVNNRDRNFTRAKMQRRMAQIEEGVARYLHQLDSADRQEPSDALAMKTERLKEKIVRLKQEMQRLEGLNAAKSGKNHKSR